VKYFLLLFVLLLGVWNAHGFSVDFNVYEEVYSPGDTFQVEYVFGEGLVSEVLSSNIDLKCNDVDVSVAPLILRLGGDRYVSYFNLPADIENGTCNFYLKDVIFFEGGVYDQRDFNVSFLVDYSNSSFYFGPAGVLVSDFDSQDFLDFYLVNNYNQAESFVVSETYDFIDVQDGELLLSSGEEGNFRVYLSEYLYDGSEKVELDISYDGISSKIPIWFDIDYVSDNDNSGVIRDEEIINFDMDVDLINVSLNDSNSTYGFVKIVNEGNIDIQNVLFELTGNLEDVCFIQFDSLDILSSGESVKQFVYVNQR